VSVRAVFLFAVLAGEWLERFVNVALDRAFARRDAGPHDKAAQPSNMERSSTMNQTESRKSPRLSLGLFGVVVTRCVWPVFAFVLLLAGTGCGSNRDVSTDKRYVTDYRVGDVFRTLQPVYLWSGQLKRTRSPDVSEAV